MNKSSRTSIKKMVKKFKIFMKKNNFKVKGVCLYIIINCLLSVFKKLLHSNFHYKMNLSLSESVTA